MPWVDTLPAWSSLSAVKRWVRVVVVVTLATPLLSTTRADADGEPVPGFGVNGVVIDNAVTQRDHVFVRDVAQLGDGSLVVTGTLTGLITATGQPNFVARYTPAGQLDTSFGNGGEVFSSNHFADLTPMPDGTVLALRSTPDMFSQGVVSIDANGGVTEVPLKFFGNIDQLIARPDGAVYVIGLFEGGAPAGTRIEVRVVRPDRQIDVGYSGDLSSVIAPTPLSPAIATHRAVLLSDGRLVIARSHQLAGGGSSCSIVALRPDGLVDTRFGSNGVVETSPNFCRVDRFVDDEIRGVDVGTNTATLFSSDGVPLGDLVAPFNRPDLAFEGTGFFYTQSAPDSIEALDPFGDVDPAFGIGGFATFTGLSFSGFKLLDSGQLVAWGTPVGDDTSLAVALIAGSFGTALQPPAVDTSKFVPVPPVRILDTRDGTGAARAKLGPGAQIDLQITGAGGIPANADVTAVVLNVTATESTQAGFVSVYPSGTRRPIVSSLNLEFAGQTAANLVTAKVGANGNVTLFTSGGSQLVADVFGYYTPAFTSPDGRLQTSSPQRILDTRQGLGAPQAKLAPGQTIDVQVTGAGPVPASGVSAVVLNLTGDQASSDGFVTVWPTGTDRPVVSNLNLVRGDTRPNLVVVPVGASGRISLFSSGGADLIGDVDGWFTDTSSIDDSVGLFVPITPTRVLDSRQEATPPTSPGSALLRRIGSTTVVPPASSLAVAANITVTQATAPGFITAWPAHTAQPGVSNLNATHAGQTIPNAAIVPLGLDDLALFTQSGAHLIVDINGWFTNF